MKPKCGGIRPRSDQDQDYIGTLSDENIRSGLSRQADPQFWKDNAESAAYLRRWGCYLRREARKRGLI